MDIIGEHNNMSKTTYEVASIPCSKEMFEHVMKKEREFKRIMDDLEEDNKHLQEWTKEVEEGNEYPTELNRVYVTIGAMKIHADDDRIDLVKKGIDDIIKGMTP